MSTACGYNPHRGQETQENHKTRSWALGTVLQISAPHFTAPPLLLYLYQMPTYMHLGHETTELFCEVYGKAPADTCEYTRIHVLTGTPPSWASRSVANLIGLLMKAWRALFAYRLQQLRYAHWCPSKSALHGGGLLVAGWPHRGFTFTVWQCLLFWWLKTFKWNGTKQV